MLAFSIIYLLLACLLTNLTCIILNSLNNLTIILYSYNIDLKLMVIALILILLIINYFIIIKKVFN